MEFSHLSYLSISQLKASDITGAPSWRRIPCGAKARGQLLVQGRFNGRPATARQLGDTHGIFSSRPQMVNTLVLGYWYNMV